MGRAAPPRADDDDRLRLPANPAARRCEGGKNAPQVHHLSRLCPPCGAPCSSICSARTTADAAIAAAAYPSAHRPFCQSSASDAVRDFAARYKAEWLIEKNGYLGPLDARAARVDTNLRRAA